MGNKLPLSAVLLSIVHRNKLIPTSRLNAFLGAVFVHMCNQALSFSSAVRTYAPIFLRADLTEYSCHGLAIALFHVHVIQGRTTYYCTSETRGWCRLLTPSMVAPQCGPLKLKHVGALLCWYTLSNVIFVFMWESGMLEFSFETLKGRSTFVQRKHPLGGVRKGKWRRETAAAPHRSPPRVVVSSFSF